MRIARQLYAVFACGGLVLAITQAAHGTMFNVIAYQMQSNFSNYLSPVAPITYAPFSYSLPLNRLKQIDQLTLGMAMYDGDSASGQFDYNDLQLRFDGIFSNVYLNDFPDNQTVYRTFTDTSAGDILSALSSDNQLMPTVYDEDPNDNSIGLPYNYTASLRIQGRYWDSANASFTSGFNQDALTIDFGTVQLGQQLSTSFTVGNLSAPDGVTLYGTGMGASGAVSQLWTNYVPLNFSNGLFNTFTAFVEASTPGLLQTNYTLNFTDNFNTVQSLNLTLRALAEAPIPSVPEPATLAIWSVLGVAGIGLKRWKRRRKETALGRR